MRGLGAGFEEDESVLASEALSFFDRHLAPVVTVRFIPNQHNGRVGISILPHFLEPAGQVRERVAPRDVVHQQGPRSAAVVGARDGLERLLACCVPDLELDVFLCDLDGPGAKLDADGEVVLLAEALVSELQQEARLADA